MIYKPKVGMRVRIIGIAGTKVFREGVLEAEFDRDKSETGTIIEIRRMTARSHQPKLYRVELDAPNMGVLEFLGTDKIEKMEDQDGRTNS